MFGSSCTCGKPLLAFAKFFSSGLALAMKFNFRAIGLTVSEANFVVSCAQHYGVTSAKYCSQASQH